MFNFRLFSNIKVTVLIGYLLLFALAIFGLYRTYKELVILSEFTNPLTERKELDLVTNALVSLYEAESMRKVILSDDLYSSQLFDNYEISDKKVRLYIDSLHLISENENIRSSLDTVNTLLNEKKRNFLAIISLMDSIRALPYSDILSTTIITHKDVEKLGKVIDNKRIVQQDTSYYIRERRSFIDRVRAVFSTKTDSTKVVSTTGQTHLDTLAYTPAELLADTLVEYVNNINALSDRRKIAFISKLSQRQNEMLYQDNMLSSQINLILRKIEDDEKKIIEEMAEGKAAVLKRSFKTVSGIASAAILALLLFLPLTLLLINRNQKFRNKLEESNFLAQKLLKSRERLLLMISHDIKSPLSSIIGHIELMLREKMPKEDKDHLLNMRYSSEQILDLSNKLMDFHRLEQGKSTVNIVPFLPYRLLNDVSKSFIPIATKKNLFLDSHSDIDTEKMYKSDPFILKQILNNLLNNAIKFTHSGGVYINSFIEQNSNLLRISIKDTGIGIKSEDVDTIFEEFSRIGSIEDKRTIDGFGLGLPITKQLVNLLNGEINLKSEVNVGTEFNISIPLIPSDNSIDKSEDSNENGLNIVSETKLLLVDDDEAILNVYAKLLKSEGVDVELCHDSTKVIDLLEDIDVDIIFTDIQMPRMNGFELVKKIRALGGQYADIPIVAISARSDVSEKDFKAAGFTTFISKPIPFGELYKKIHDLLDQESKLNENQHTSGNSKFNGIHTLIEYVKDDKDVSLDILNTFLDDNQKKVESLKNAMETQDWDSVKFVAHKMLPLITMIGENDIVKKLEVLESGKEDMELLTSLIPEVERVNLEAVQFIEQFKNG